jgi:hypothetical protein
MKDKAQQMTVSAGNIRLLKIAILTAMAAISMSFCGQHGSKQSDLYNTTASEVHLYTATISALMRESRLTFETDLQKVTNEVKPQDTKELRKRIGEIRDLFDLFAHNFHAERDLLKSMRRILDDGYTVIGDFKDLYDGAASAGKAADVKFKKSLVEKRRNKILRWKSDYFAPNGYSDQLQKLAAAARPLEPHIDLDRKDLSRFFWGGVDILPNPALGPAENARLLALAQAQKVFEQAESVNRITNVSKSKSETRFHDFRKRVRAVAKVCNLAIRIQGDSCAKPAVDAILILVDRLGTIEDLLTGAALLENEKDSKAASKQFDAAQKAFDNFKAEWTQRDMLEPLKQL